MLNNGTSTYVLTNVLGKYLHHSKLAVLYSSIISRLISKDKNEQIFLEGGTKGVI